MIKKLLNLKVLFIGLALVFLSSSCNNSDEQTGLLEGKINYGTYSAGGLAVSFAEGDKFTFSGYEESSNNSMYFSITAQISDIIPLEENRYKMIIDTPPLDCKITLLNDEIVTKANEASWAGYKDWKVNVEKNLNIDQLNLLISQKNGTDVKDIPQSQTYIVQVSKDKKLMMFITMNEKNEMTNLAVLSYQE